MGRKVSMSYYYQKSIFLLVIFLCIINISEARWTFGTDSIQQKAEYLENKLCPSNVDGALGSNNYFVHRAVTNFDYGHDKNPATEPQIEYFFCENVVSTQQSSMVVVDIISAQNVDGSVPSGGFSCPPDKPVVCGMRGSPTGNGNDDNSVDMLKCCAVKDIIVNLSNSIQLLNVNSNTVDLCPSDHPVMCGAVNQVREKIQGIFCCAVYFEGDVDGSCEDGVDNDHDNFKDCFDIDCDGTLLSDGNTCGNGEVSCNNGFDDDGDGYIDMEDYDCFVTQSASDSWDNDGPIPSSIFVEPGIKKTPSGYSWWFPSATNGSDAVCGDDGFSQTCFDPSGTIYFNCASYNSLCIYGSCKDSMIAGLTNCNANSICTSTTTNQYLTLGLDMVGCSDAPACEVGDTQISSTTAECTLCIFPPCSYVSSRTCQTSTPLLADCVGFSGIDCASKSISECVAPCSINTAYPENIWSRDYGYIFNFSTGNFMCYNNFTFINNPVNKWTWLEAGVNPFIITTLNDSANKQIDTISNSEEWFYCDATNTVSNTFGGIAVSEYGTFDNPPYLLGDEVACYRVLSSIVKDGAGNPVEFVNQVNCGGVPTTQGCCKSENVAGDPFMVPRNKLYSCFYAGQCTYQGLEKESDFCNTYPTYCSSGNVGISVILEFLQKELCENQLQGCLGQNVYDPELACDNEIQGVVETDYNYIPCSSVTNICKNGIFVETDPLPTEGNCCLGISTGDNPVECVTIITGYDTCVERGRMFNPEIESCEGKTWWGSTTSDACCAGIVFDNGFSFNPKGSNMSFLCFKYNGDNILSECGYNVADISNADIIPTNPTQATPSNTQKRISSTGETPNFFENFDKVSNGAIIDYYSRMTFQEPISQTIYIADTKLMNVGHYSYLEFDIAYSLKEFNVQLFDGYSTYVNIDIFKYLVDGDLKNRAHHVIIPLKSLSPKLNNLYSIKFTATTPLSITVDNIRFTPEGDDLIFVSDNRYCSGGFGKWLDALEPDLNTYDWTSTFYTNWSQYGPYAFACKSYFSYAWTGHQCCGDDTRIFSDGSRNYGEFYNDTLAGCFNATRIYSDMSISYIKGYVEANSESFNNYTYKDLMYFDNKFLGCQVPQNKYVGLTVSYTGNEGGLSPENQGQSLFNSNNNVLTQCAVSGSYYCFNNAWRQTVNADNYLGNWKTEGLSFKSSPPGVNIIKNGDFSG